MRIGIIGCGALGVIHAQRFCAIEGIAVTALSDPSEAAMDRAASVLQTRPNLLTTDYRRLLDSGLDAVCIASPDSHHVPQVLDSLAANLHVLCEKPLTPSPDDLSAVIASSEEVDRVVSLTYPRRYDFGIRRMRDEIQSGRHGRVTSIMAYNAEDWITPNRGTWRHDPIVCPGGFFYDASGHQLDTLLWVSGLRAERVWAESDNRDTPNIMFMRGQATLTGDVPLTFTFVGDGHKWREEIHIHCERTDFTIENARGFVVKDEGNVPLDPGFGEESADAAFVRLVCGEGKNWAPPAEIWPVLTLTNAALESARRRTEVEVMNSGA